MHLLFYIIIIFLFDKILSDDLYDFHKDEQIQTTQKYCIFDSSIFNIGDEIYFKIKATEFNKKNLGYMYLDTIPNDFDFTSIISIQYEEPEKETEIKDDNNKIEKYIKYYIIKKTNENLSDLEGKYLILYFDCKGILQVILI